MFKPERFLRGSKKRAPSMRKSPVICISGLAGSGKSTFGRRLAENYSLRYFSGGEALKALAAEEGYRSTEQGFWESREGMRFLEERSKNMKLDESVDKKLLKLAEDGGVVLDSWTMPWLLKEGFKIWLDASIKKRAERVAQRDGITVKEALQALRVKEARTRSIYWKLYRFKLGDDFAPFHLILDTDQLDSEEVFATLSKAVENIVLRVNIAQCGVEWNK